jgi:hypothetical protein
MFLFGCTPFTVLYCPPDREPVTVLKDVNKAYPVYAVSYDANLQAAFNELTQLQISASGALKTQITSLRQQLDQESSRIQDLLKTAVLGMQATPCDPTARANFWAALKETNDNAVKIAQFTKDLQQNGLPSSSPPPAGPATPAAPNEGRVKSVIDRFRSQYSFVK